MIKINSKNDQIVLRSFLESDIDDCVLWNTEDIEWMNWDAPWEKDEIDVLKEKERWTQYFKRVNTMDEHLLKTRLEICINNEEQTHIGWVSCYHIDEHYKYTSSGGNIAIGLVIPSMQYRGKGYGKSALVTYIDYLKSLGNDTIFTQTWSGNLPMIALAERLGFKECNRYIDLREINGIKYDALTFRISGD